MCDGGMKRRAVMHSHTCKNANFSTAWHWSGEGAELLVARLPQGQNLLGKLTVTGSAPQVMA